jgi:anti-sigma-K factor RskA
VQHCDDDELSVIALGEPARPEDDAHLAQCPRCRSRLDQLGAVVSTARAIRENDRALLAPPDDLWTGIAAELGLGTDELAQRRAARSGGTSRRWFVLVAAAAAGVLLGGFVTFQLTQQPADVQVIASGTLGEIDASGLTGTATVERTPEGASLVVGVADLPSAGDGYYEVWMATADTSTMVSLGTLNPGTEAHLPLPEGMDVTAFPVVDVSLEHFDGDAGHSATSLVRGTLQS